jgi:hypothetical protein
MQKAKNPPKRVFLMLNDKYIFNIHKIGCTQEDDSAGPRPAGRC